MSDYTKDLKRYLQDAGCRFDRQGKGDHEIWFSPISKIKFVVDNCDRFKNIVSESITEFRSGIQGLQRLNKNLKEIKHESL